MQPSPETAGTLEGDVPSDSVNPESPLQPSGAVIGSKGPVHGF